MKLVETDIVHEEDEDEVPEVPTPPRPEHRRVYVSLFLTFSVLVATVAAVYSLFPKRDNVVFGLALEAHRSPDLELVEPSPPEVAAWTVGLLGSGLHWPDPGPQLRILGARGLTILRRRAGLVRYQAAGSEVTLVALRTYEAPPRRRKKVVQGTLIESWRSGAWTFIAVGPAATAGEWGPLVGLP